MTKIIVSIQNTTVKDPISFAGCINHDNENVKIPKNINLILRPMDQF